MGIGVLSGIQGQGWDHMKENVGASNLSKGSIEVCVL
jgi:hypothetical protein